MLFHWINCSRTGYRKIN